MEIVDEVAVSGRYDSRNALLKEVMQISLTGRSVLVFEGVDFTCKESSFRRSAHVYADLHNCGVRIIRIANGELLVRFFAR